MRNSLLSAVMSAAVALAIGASSVITMNKQRTIRKWTVCLLLAFFLLPAAISSAAVTSYLLEITSGLAHTSGGLHGQGKGDVILEGQFRLNIDPAINYVALEDVSLTPIVGFDWSSLVGTINGIDIDVSSPNPLHSIDNYLAGTFDGSSAHLEGLVADPFFDGYSYDCIIEAQVVPEPATLSLLAVGGVAMLRRRRRK